MSATSGFKITFTGFLPCENRLDALLAGSKTLADVEAAGLVDVKRTDTFVKVQRVKSGPPAVDAGTSLAADKPDPQVAGGEVGGRPATAAEWEYDPRDCDHEKHDRVRDLSRPHGPMICAGCGTDPFAVPASLRRTPAA